MSAVRFEFIICFAFVVAVCLFCCIDACLEREKIRAFGEQEHVQLLEEEKLYALEWNGRITPKLFYVMKFVERNEHQRGDLNSSSLAGSGKRLERGLQLRGRHRLKQEPIGRVRHR